MTDQKRPYRMNARAQARDATRRRITESAVALHGTLAPERVGTLLGPVRAGVGRAALYRHFPDESALFAACASHWAVQNPPPDPGAWAEVEDPAQRLAVA